MYELLMFILIYLYFVGSSDLFGLCAGHLYSWFISTYSERIKIVGTPDAIYYNYPYALSKMEHGMVQRRTEVFNFIISFSTPISQCWGFDKGSDNITQISFALGERVTISHNQAKCANPSFHDCRFRQ